jgi:hypothetical protein
MLTGDSVFEGDGDHAAGGKIHGMRCKLADLTMIPTAAEEKRRHWQGHHSRFIRGRTPEVGVQLFIAHDLEGLLMC